MSKEESAETLEHDDYDLTEAVLNRIRSYDRAKLRELFESAKQKFSIAEIGRRRDELCMFILDWERDSESGDLKPPTRCCKPSVRLDYDEAPCLCEEHYGSDVGSFERESLMTENLGQQIRRSFNNALDLSFRCRWLLPVLLSDVLIPLTVFYIIGDEELRIGEAHLSKFSAKGYPEYTGVPYILIVDTRIPEDRIDYIAGWWPSIKTYYQFLLDENLISDEDLSWIKQSAQRAMRIMHYSLAGKLLKTVTSQSHQAVLESLDKPLTNGDRSKLWEYQQELLQIWQDATEQAIKDQSHHLRAAQWRESIRHAYYITLPDDLIEWLNQSVEQRDSYLLNRTDLIYLQKRLEEGYTLSRPSEIALEHAARLCGLSPYSKAPSTLWAMCRESKRAEQD